MRSWIPPTLGVALSLSALTSSSTVAISNDGVPSEPGLLGEYYDAKSPPGDDSPADFARVDPVLDFSWPGDAPDGTSIAADDQYSERWSGLVSVPSAGTWTFTTTSNDGVRLWVDGQLIISNWTQHTATDDSAAINLPAPGWYPIRLEHFNDGGTAIVRLLYQGPGVPLGIIPSDCLRTELPGAQPPTVEAGEDQYIVPPETAATLDATVDAPEGIADLSWTQISGPPASITDPNSLTTTVLPTTAGFYVFRLTATDLRAVTAVDDVRVLVFGTGGVGDVRGALKKWHKVSITFAGVETSEADVDNPFRNYRLECYLVHPASGSLYQVPGFYAADGDAANTGADSGASWRVRFTPDRSGEWHYLASFRTGPDVAVDPAPLAGEATSFDGASGTFQVAPADPNAPGFLGQGMLRYVGRHQLQFAESGDYYLKGGADSPENLLGYFEFDGTWDTGGLSTPGLIDGLHRYAPHAAQYRQEDEHDAAALWMSGRGKNIVGALNYLSGQGMNSVYFLTYNIDGGDGGDTWVWVDPHDPSKSRFDVSKLAQWERVFSHMDARGIQLHVVTQEAENDQVLGSLTLARKLYYRELVSRFAHHLAVIWNLGEENNNNDAERLAFASYIRSLDPYDHPITVHTHSGQASTFYNGLLGHNEFEATSIQGDASAYASWSVELRERSAAAGRPWAIYGDEQWPPVAPDLSNLTALRKDALWGNLSGGGAGVEWYFGYQETFSDLASEDWTAAQPLWEQTRIALDFFQAYLPFSEMEPDNALTAEGDDQVLAKPGEIYVIYRPNGGGATLDLRSTTNTFAVRWYDPRSGGGLRLGSVASVTGSGARWIGTPPSGGDWVALIRTACEAASDCDDGDVCNGIESCSPTGACIGGAPLVCDDGNPCSEHMCHPVSGCETTLRLPGASCSDDDACNGDELCDAAGACLPGVAPNCEDGDACTVDACDASSGCSHLVVTCDDGNPCTDGFCDSGGICQFLDRPDGATCGDGDVCNGMESAALR
jgi:hypothetical protein